VILDEKLTQDIKEIYQRLNGEGELLSRTQLAKYYDVFRQRFGPDKLASLDGEALLETIHNHGNRDSLVYWLEFKDDDEFPANFGSIAGGSALKFGIYRRRETGAWTTGSPTSQKELSVEEAIEYARKHRNELIKAAGLLERLPQNGTDEDYKTLQEGIDREAPSISDTAWGHKYLSLLYPNKLDDYHNADYQRFHLIKLLQFPPRGEGRYIVAGRFVAIANELEMPINNLTTITNERHGRPYKYWRIGTSDGKQPRNRWALMYDNDCVAVGWEKLSNLSEIAYNRESKEKVRNLMQGSYPNISQEVGRETQQVFYFVAGIAEGDIVLASDGSSVLGIGKIIGDYFYEPSSDFPHRRPVRWLNLDEWKMPKPEGLRTTLHLVKKNIENLVETERRILYAPSIDKEPTPSEMPSLPGLLGRIQSILERKGQLIIYGPPGTGKTYWAELAARELASYSRFKLPFDKLNQEQRAFIIGKEGVADGSVRFCCFHPAYGYEDFMEGYRPESPEGQVVFNLKDGIFKKICQDAWAGPQHRFYLIIDEINRGDVPRIFGELLTVIEKDKRGKPIILPLSGLPFRVPGNLYILGTMNTADRSIALLDTALRRRFGFIELMPDLSVLGSASVSGIPLGPWLAALNRRICEHIGRDARNLQIGHSYLLEEGRPIKDFSRFTKAIRDDIIPLLQEYCYEDFPTLEMILGKGLIDKEGQQIRYELFNESKQEELIQALLAPSPEISTSSEALISEAEAPEPEEETEESDAVTQEEQ
jgi:5-methylcytosine-specific restriction protein B